MKRRTSNAVVAAATMASLAALCLAGPARAADVRFRSPDEALRQGMSAFNGGYYEIALPALEHAARSNLFLGQYFLARLYADNNGAHTDHPKAYLLYQHIANEFADIDPDDDRRAPYVARATTALARYRLNGLPEFGVKPNPEGAAQLFRHAATVFGDEDAQFELAKLKLKGEGVEKDVAYARHLLSVLSQKGHAPAQAFLADLLNRGTVLERDNVRALALITIAVENAPTTERFWIEDTFQHIYCGAGQGIRKQATGVVAEWRDRYGRKQPDASRDFSGLAALGVNAERACENGEPVPLKRPGQEAKAKEGAPSPAVMPIPSLESVPQPDRPAAPDRTEIMKGSSAVGLRDVGVTVPHPRQN